MARAAPAFEKPVMQASYGDFFNDLIEADFSEAARILP